MTIDLNGVDDSNIPGAWIQVQTTRPTPYIDPQSPAVSYAQGISPGSTDDIEFLTSAQFTEQLVGRHHRLLAALVPLLGALSAGGAQAALISKENGSLVYDTNRNLTWLADAGQAGGFLDWAAANTWAAGLTVAGIGGWRLPTADPGGAYYDTTSELRQLFYGGLESRLGGAADHTITDVHNANYGLFSNITADGYWTGTAALDPAYAWTFSYYDGTQLAYEQLSGFGAWAVHTGDVPEPATVLLLTLGTAGLFGRRRATRNTHASNPQ